MLSSTALCAAYAGGCEEQRLRALALLYRAIARPNRAYATEIAPRSRSGSYLRSGVALPPSPGGETDGSSEEQRDERSGGGAADALRRKRARGALPSARCGVRVADRHSGAHQVPATELGEHARVDLVGLEPASPRSRAGPA